MRRDGTFSGSYAPGSGAIPILIFGIFWTILTLFLLTTCLDVASSFGAGACAGPAIFFAIGVLMIVAGVVSLIWRRGPGPRIVYPPVVPPPIVDPRPLPSSSPPPQVRCRYCGRLTDAGLTNCPSCGAPL